jgi:hypothetical protein
VRIKIINEDKCEREIMCNAAQEIWPGSDISSGDSICEVGSFWGAHIIIADLSAFGSYEPTVSHFARYTRYILSNERARGAIITSASPDKTLDDHRESLLGERVKFIGDCHISHLTPAQLAAIYSAANKTLFGEVGL